MFQYVIILSYSMNQKCIIQIRFIWYSLNKYKYIQNGIQLNLNNFMDKYISNGLHNRLSLYKSSPITRGANSLMERTTQEDNVR